MEKYRKAIEAVNKNGNWFRLGKTFRTSEALYFLDTGTGKVFKVNENVYRVLDCLFRTNSFNNLYKINLPKQDIEAALKEICNAINTQHLFSAPPLSKNNVLGQHLNLEENLKNDMSSITLELTERCNLRCKYCVYSETNNDFRSFGERDMSLDTAQKSIDFLMEHSSQDKKVYIGLYGGEPLLRFPLVKQIIEYVKSKYPQRKVFYSMTSNRTLMTEEIAEFLSNIEDMSIVVSMDGPEEIHDNQRVFVDGRGTFTAAMKGLDTYMKWKEKSINKDKPFAISTVITLPYDKDKFEKMDVFFKSLRKKYAFSVLVSYVSHTSPSVEYININDRPENDWVDGDERTHIYDPLMIWTLNNLKDDIFTNNYFTKVGLLEIHKRYISDMPIDTYSLNGCCVPGARRLYVTAAGNFLPCERVGTQLPIGNVNKGFDIDFIKKNYVEGFIEQEVKYCGECWAINLCNNCYMNCFGNDGVDFSHRHTTCSNTRKRISESLSIYHEVMARKPEFIEQLKDVIIE